MAILTPELQQIADELGALGFGVQAPGSSGSESRLYINHTQDRHSGPMWAAVHPADMIAKGLVQVYFWTSNDEDENLKSYMPAEDVPGYLATLHEIVYP